MVWLFVAAGCLIVAIGTALTKLPVPAVFSSAIAAVGAIVASFWTTRAAAVLKARDDRVESHAALVRSDHRGRLPLVSELDDPVRLGVHPAAGVDGVPRVPAFVRRDVMDHLADLIARDKFVLLVGESTAGKTRAAYEVVRTLFPGHRLVEPNGREGSAAAVQAAIRCARSVLWLDDIERFLGEGGLTGVHVSAVLGAKGSERVIVATMRSEEHAYFGGGSTADPMRSKEMIRQGWDVLRLASRIDLARSWSWREVSRAKEAGARDPRIAEALARADQFGIAEYLAAGPQLLSAWKDAWAPGEHPRGAALVLAAIDARRAGIHRPVPLTTLIRAHESYLLERGGVRLRPEPLEEALAWATRPLHATSSLLLPDGDEHIAFDYLIDAVDREAIPVAAAEALIDAGSPEELRDIGRFVWGWNRLDQAELAYQRAVAFDQENRSNQGYVIAERDGAEAHRQFLRRTAAELQSSLGAQHEETLTAKFGVAWYSGNRVNVRLSLGEIELLLPELNAVLGPRHRTTLLAKRGIACYFDELGEHRRAADLFLTLVVDCLDNNIDERLTCTMMLGYSRCVREASPSRAVQLYDELDGLFAEMRAPEDLRLSLRFARAGALLRAKERERAIVEYQEMAVQREKANGRFNIETVQAKLELINCIGELGQKEQALSLARELAEESQRSRSPHEPLVLTCQRAVARWTGMCGNEQEALQLLYSLRDGMAGSSNHDQIIGIERGIRLWQAVAATKSGAEAEGHRELRGLIEDVRITDGLTQAAMLRVGQVLDELALRRTNAELSRAP